MKNLVTFGLGLVIGACYGAYKFGQILGDECKKRGGTWTIDFDKYHIKCDKKVTISIIE